jgi:hypothetical protein
MLVLAHARGYRRPQAWIADPVSEYFYRCPDNSALHTSATVAYRGQIYMAYSNGSVFRRVGSARKGHESIIAAGKLAGQKEVVFLVESAGVLLLVLGQWSNLKVFRVNVEQKALEPADNIGGRALFLGRRVLVRGRQSIPQHRR